MDELKEIVATIVALVLAIFIGGSLVYWFMWAFTQVPIGHDGKNAYTLIVAVAALFTWWLGKSLYRVVWDGIEFTTAGETLQAVWAWLKRLLWLPVRYLARKALEK